MKNNVILGFFIVFLFFNMYFAFSNEYNERKYVVKMDNADVSYYLKEDYVYSVVPIFVHAKNWKKQMISNADNISMMSVPLGRAYLNFENYDCNSSYTTKRISCSTTMNHMVVAKNNLVPNKLVIQYKDEVIYNGEFKTDLNDIIQTAGRYYFSLYLTTSDHLLEKTTTEIDFQIKFVGDNYE